jgi:glycosyltransferase involved in cell wall biosynthesis
VNGGERPRLLEVVGYSRTGGAASSTVELLPHLREDGFDVVVAAPPEPRFEAAVAAGGARFVAAPMAGRADWRSLAALARLLRRERFDVVHTHCRNADLHGGLAARLAGGGATLVAHLRGLLVDGNGELGRGLVDRVHRAFLARFPAKLIAISEAVRRRALEALRVRPERVVVVRNGVDVRSFAAAAAPAAAKVARARLLAELGLDASSTLLLQVGTLGRCKGQDLLLQALARLPSVVVAAFAGDADPGARDSLGELARSLGVESRVRFLGPRDDVPPLLAAADVVVQPSRWEGFGRAVAEAMAAGKPVVASGAGGLAELVSHERTGLQVDPERDDLLAAAIARLVDDRRLADRLGREARLFAEHELDARSTARGVARVLREAAGLAPSPPAAPPAVPRSRALAGVAR